MWSCCKTLRQRQGLIGSLPNWTVDLIDNVQIPPYIHGDKHSQWRCWQYPGNHTPHTAKHALHKHGSRQPQANSMLQWDTDISLLWHSYISEGISEHSLCAGHMYRSQITQWSVTITGWTLRLCHCTDLFSLIAFSFQFLFSSLICALPCVEVIHMKPNKYYFKLWNTFVLC